MLLYAGARSVGRAFRHRVSGAYELRKRVRPDGAAPSLHRPSGVRELPQAGSPFPGGKFFAEPQRGIRRLRTAGASRRPPRGQKGRTTCGFPSSLNSYLSLISYPGENRRAATAAKQGNDRGFFLPCLSQPVRRVRYRSATQVGGFAQAQHTRVAQIVFTLFRPAPTGFN